MIFNKNGSRFLIVGLTLLIHSFVLAQTRTTSPYSIYGLGEVNNVFNIKSLSMGGISYSIYDNGTINFANPASYAALDTLSFLFDAGMLANNLSLKNATTSEKTSYASLNYLSLGFSVNKWWKTSLGLVPYSNVGYNYSYVEDVENVGNVKFYDHGYGGVNQLYWGHAFKIGEHFSVGVNIGYYFGNINKERAVAFIDSVNFMSTNTISTVSINDFNYNYGVHYHSKLKGLDLAIGAIYSSKASLKATREDISRTFVTAYTNVEDYRDTISLVLDDHGSVVIPQNLGIGFMISSPNNWKIAAEFQKQYWKEFRAFNAGDSLQNTWRFGVGAEIIPNYNSVNSYFKRVSYRMGIKYEQTPFLINNKQIKDFGISFGVGLPLRNSKSTVNVGLEFGQRGTVKNSLIQEKYFKFMLGITMQQYWFVKRKYN